jgi:hypothetical protein
LPLPTALNDSETTWRNIRFWRAAILLLRGYGDKVEEQSDACADEIATEGDYHGTTCHRITDAVRNLANMTPPGRQTEPRGRAGATALLPRLTLYGSTVARPLRRLGGFIIENRFYREFRGRGRRSGRTRARRSRPTRPQPRRHHTDPSPMIGIPTAPAGCSPDSCHVWTSA